MLKLRDLASRPDMPFGELIVSPSRRNVAGPAGETSLEPRVMQVLLLLLDAKGMVVTRDQLFDECWGGAPVGDDSINRTIGRLRRVPDEVAPGAFEIETIPRTGYRLQLRRATPIDPANAEAEADKGMASTLTRRWMLAGGLAAVSGAGFWFYSSPSSPDPAELFIEESRLALRSGSPQAEARALALLRRAVSVSPKNAHAWGALALMLAQADEHSTTKASTPASEVEQAARRALQLDGGNADAEAALAIAIPYYGDWLAAERRFDAILARHPKHVATQDSRSFLLGAVGRMQESADARLAFTSAQPLNPELEYRHVYALWFLNRITEADRVSSRAFEMWPRHSGVWFSRLWLLAGSGRLDRALAHVADQDARPRMPPPLFETLRAGLAAAIIRNPDRVNAAVGKVMSGVERSVAAVINAMMLLNLMGAIDEAFELADAYYLERGPIIAAMSWRPGQPVVPDQRRRKTNMLFTPIAAPMQRDARFLPLMEEMGLVRYWRQRGIQPDFLKR